MNKSYLFALASVAAIGALSGCTPDAKSDYSQAGAAITTAAKDTGKAIKTDVDHASGSVKSSSSSSSSGSSGNSGGGTMDKAKAALTNDETSLKVKQALDSASDVQAQNIKVDTNGSSVLLHGTVPTAAQKNKATAIAKDILGSGYKIQNQLLVGPS